MLGRRTIVVVVLSLAVVAISTVYAQLAAPQRELQGIKPYTPTRLEWLAVELNAFYRVDSLHHGGYTVTFVAIHQEDTILLYVSHTSDANREVMNMGVNTARKVFDVNVKAKGWDSWVNLREKVVMLEQR